MENQKDTEAQTTPAAGGTPNPSEPSAPKTSTRKQPEIKKPLSTSPAAPPGGAPVKVQVRNRHDVAFRHDVFMSDAKDCARNISFVYLKPEIVMVPHKHVYHSHNNQGKKLARTGSAAGHWHYIEHFVNAAGEIKAKCGPAMHEVTIISPSGRSYNKIEEVAFEREVTNGPNAGSTERVVDDHTHEMAYLGSEELSPQGIQAALEKDRKEAAVYGIALGANSVKDLSPAPLTAADGVTMIES